MAWQGRRTKNGVRAPMAGNKTIHSWEQGEVARILRVTESTVWNWESHRSSPPIHQCKPVIDFIGCDPFPEPLTLAEKLVSFRRVRGLRVKDAAALAGVDPASWSSWEREEHQITETCRERIHALLHSRFNTAMRPHGP